MIYVTSAITVQPLLCSPDTVAVLREYHRYYTIGYDDRGEVMHLESSEADVVDTVQVCGYRRSGGGLMQSTEART